MAEGVEEAAESNSSTGDTTVMLGATMPCETISPTLGNIKREFIDNYHNTVRTSTPTPTPSIPSSSLLISQSQPINLKSEDYEKEPDSPSSVCSPLTITSTTSTSTTPTPAAVTPTPKLNERPNLSTTTNLINNTMGGNSGGGGGGGAGCGTVEHSGDDGGGDGTITGDDRLSPQDHHVKAVAAAAAAQAHLNGTMQGMINLQKLQNLAKLQQHSPTISSLTGLQGLANLSSSSSSSSSSLNSTLNSPLNLSIGSALGNNGELIHNHINNINSNNINNNNNNNNNSCMPQLILASGQLMQGVQGAQLLIPTSQGITTQTILTIPVSQQINSNNDQLVQTLAALSNGGGVSSLNSSTQSISQSQSQQASSLLSHQHPNVSGMVSPNVFSNNVQQLLAAIQPQLFSQQNCHSPNNKHSTTTNQSQSQQQQQQQQQSSSHLHHSQSNQSATILHQKQSGNAASASASSSSVSLSSSPSPLQTHLQQQHQQHQQHRQSSPSTHNSSLVQSPCKEIIPSATSSSRNSSSSTSSHYDNKSTSQSTNYSSLSNGHIRRDGGNGNSSGIPDGNSSSAGGGGTNNNGGSGSSSSSSTSSNSSCGNNNNNNNINTSSSSGKSNHSHHHNNHHNHHNHHRNNQHHSSQQQQQQHHNPHHHQHHHQSHHRSISPISVSSAINNINRLSSATNGELTITKSHGPPSIHQQHPQHQQHQQHQQPQQQSPQLAQSTTSLSNHSSSSSNSNQHISSMKICSSPMQLSPTGTDTSTDLLDDSPNEPTINQTNCNVVDGIDLDEIKEFAKAFKLRRLSLGLTQTQVGQALSVTEGPAYSQSAICSALAAQMYAAQLSSQQQQNMFEKLDITPKSAQKIKPVLERWMKEAEESHWNRYKSGQNHLTDFIGVEPSKKRKRRTSFTPQALELLNAHFERNTHPSGTEITGLAHQLGYEREVIRIWFCNKRQALKNTVRMMSKGMV